MRRKHVRLKTKQTLQFGELEITVSCIIIIIPIDPIRIITRLIEISIRELWQPPRTVVTYIPNVDVPSSQSEPRRE